MNALIGHTGFVGSSLLRQRPDFEARFSSVDIESIAGRRFERIVCAGAPGAKWRANADPAADWRSVSRLIGALRRVSCAEFVLISTVDVFGSPEGVDESTAPAADGLHPYGRHRLELERFVRTEFPDARIVRLSGLVGPGLRKNACHDLHHSHDVDRLDARAVLQFYPIARLGRDLDVAREVGFPLVHLAAEPLRLGEVARQVFGHELRAGAGAAPVRYGVRSRYAEDFGGAEGWPVSAAESIAAIREYAATEPRTPR